MEFQPNLTIPSIVFLFLSTKQMLESVLSNLLLHHAKDIERQVLAETAHFIIFFFAYSAVTVANVVLFSWKASLLML